MESKKLTDLEEGEKKKFLITLEGCDGCEEIKEDLKEAIEEGKISVAHCNDDESNPDDTDNLVIVARNEINIFPCIVDIEKKDGKYKLCEYDLETMKIKECREMDTNVGDEVEEESVDEGIEQSGQDEN